MDSRVLVLVEVEVKGWDGKEMMTGRKKTSLHIGKTFILLFPFNYLFPLDELTQSDGE